VRDILARYDRLAAFTEDRSAGLPAFAFGCGRQAATGFVLRAVRRFHREQPDVPFRISHLRGQARIEGVANGSLDLAAVTDREETITAVARGELHIDALPEEPLVLVAAHMVPRGGPIPAWHAAFMKLSPRGVSAEALPSFPLIVPEPDADVRRVLDAAVQQVGVLNQLEVVLEMGGWQAILAYVREGLGVGVVTRTAFEQDPHGLEIRMLNRRAFPPTRLRLICRTRLTAPEELDLSPSAARFRELLLEEGRNLVCQYP
jgi:DNA-binding transcriptional LysR family regulator